MFSSLDRLEIAKADTNNLPVPLVHYEFEVCLKWEFLMESFSVESGRLPTRAGIAFGFQASKYFGGIFCGVCAYVVQFLFILVVRVNIIFFGDGMICYSIFIRWTNILLCRLFFSIIYLSYIFIFHFSNDVNKIPVFPIISVSISSVVPHT